MGFVFCNDSLHPNPSAFTHPTVYTHPAAHTHPDALTDPTSHTHPDAFTHPAALTHPTAHTNPSAFTDPTAHSPHCTHSPRCTHSPHCIHSPRCTHSPRCIHSPSCTHLNEGRIKSSVCMLDFLTQNLVDKTSFLFCLNMYLTLRNFSFLICKLPASQFFDPFVTDNQLVYLGKAINQKGAPETQLGSLCLACPSVTLKPSGPHFIVCAFSDQLLPQGLFMPIVCPPLFQTNKCSL